MNCGLCCDATLFLHATLQPGERGHLPEKIEEAGSTGDGGDYFLLPCGYFSGACTIYDCQRADVCSTFRCRLLKVFAGGGISQADALRTVREAVANAGCGSGRISSGDREGCCGRVQEDDYRPGGGDEGFERFRCVGCCTGRGRGVVLWREMPWMV
ncbi:MAG: hypothetical protein IPI74_03485 [Bacteroidales bacterium]|nr:hypothetical protein [Bacteroidales bacterium]